MRGRPLGIRGWLALTGVALLASLAGLGLARCDDGAVATSSSAVSISAPGEMVAGTRLVVVVTADGIGPIHLDVNDAFATTTFSEPIVDGHASFTLPDSLAELSGMLMLRARGDRGGAVMTTTRIIPGPPDGSIDIHAGPRTIVADGADRTMAIAIPTDAFGNPLADGTTVTITRLDAEGGASHRTTAVDGGLAALFISSDTTAGRVEVFATHSAVGAAVRSHASRRVAYEEVPGPAVRVELERVDDDRLVADGRGLVDVRTKPISDRFGNQLLDGHVVRVHVSGPAGSGQLTARTIDGVARFEMPAPDRPGQAELIASVGGVTSAPIELDFGSAVSSLPIEVHTDEGRVVVGVGPVLDAAGAVVIDGTVVTVAGLPGREPIELQLVDGRASIDVAVGDAQGDLAIHASVLGASTVGEPR